MLSCIDYDKLLEYLSYVKSGSYEQFKNYINNLDYDDELIESTQEKKISNPYTPIAKMFSRLGHIEFDYKKDRFAVCPPTLVLLPNSKDGILAGSRTKKFLDSLDSLGCEIEKIENYDAPKCIIVKNIKDYLDELKLYCRDLRISENFSNNVLSIVPTIKQYEKDMKNRICQNPVILESKSTIYNTRFYNFTTQFNDTNEKGLYLLKKANRRYSYYFFDGKTWYEKIDRAYGIFIVLRDDSKNVLKYANNSLYLYRKISFPKLVDRALTMYSGKNPQIDKQYIKYDNIESSVAQKVAQILGQH